MERFEAMPRPWGPRKAVGHSHFHIGAGGCGRRFFLFFRIFEVFQHVPALHHRKQKFYTSKQVSEGYIWRGLKQYRGLWAPRRPWDIAVFYIGAGGCGRRVLPCFFAFSRFFSTFQHYTLEKANVLYIKTRSVGAYLDRFEAIPRPWEPPEGRGT